MAGLAFRNPGGGMFHATGTQYENPTHGTRRLCLRTGAGANGVVKYGFTSDVSASQYCRMSMRMPNGVVGRIGRYQTLTKSSSSSTNIQYETSRETSVKTTTGSTRATKSTSINGTTSGGSKVIPFRTESCIKNQTFYTDFYTTITTTETRTNWGTYYTTYTATNEYRTTSSTYTTSDGRTTTGSRYVTNGTFNSVSYTTSTHSYIGTPVTFTYTDHPRDAMGNVYIGTVTVTGTSGTTYCTTGTTASSYHTLQTALTSSTRPNNTYYIPSGGGGWGPPITDWNWSGYVTTNTVNRTVTYDTHVGTTGETSISSSTKTTSMSKRTASNKWTATSNNFNL